MLAVSAAAAVLGVPAATTTARRVPAAMLTTRLTTRLTAWLTTGVLTRLAARVAARAVVAHVSSVANTLEGMRPLFKPLLVGDPRLARRAGSASHITGHIRAAAYYTAPLE